jgi:hypothetical protein
MKLYEIFFDEVKRPTTSYINKNAKIDREIGRLSNQVAKDKEDSLQKRMEFHRNKYEYFKKQILLKYSSRVKNQARK